MYKSRKFKIVVAGVTALIFLATFVLFANSRATLNLSFLTNLFGNSNVQGVSTSVTTVKPSLDTFVRSAYPTKNYEGGSEIVSDGDPRVNSLLRFDLSNVNLNNVTKAELAITSTLNRKVNKTIKLITSGWTASSVTWNTSPTFGATLGTITGDIKTGVTKNYALDLAQVKAAGSALNIAIDDTSSGDSMTFKSLETGTPGAVLLLTITTTTPTEPEPTQPTDPVTTTTTGTTTGSTTDGTTTGTTTTGGSTTGTTTTGGTTTGGTTGGTTPTEPTTPSASTGGIWVSKEDIKKQPTSGNQWNAVYSVAKSNWGSPDLANQDSNHDQFVMAGAIVCVRTGEFCDKAKDGVVAAIGTEGNSRWLAIGRNLMGYVIAADLLDLRADGNSTSKGSRVQTWLGDFLTKLLPDNNTGVLEVLKPFESGSNASAQEGGVYISLAAYFKDAQKLQYAWNRFRLFSCDSSSPEKIIDVSRGVSYNWAHSTTTPCAIVPKGETKAYNGKTYRLDGAIINDMRRGGEFKWTPGYTSYPWVGLEGYVPAAVMLARQGYGSFEVTDKAVQRTFEYLWYLRTNTGNVDWFDGKRADETTHIVNKYYGSTYPVQSAIGSGRTVGFTGYTFPTKSEIIGQVTAAPQPVDPVTPTGNLTAVITANPTSGVAPLTVAFSANSSTSRSNSVITGYLWTFDDGSTSTSATVNHTFSAADEYNVTLRVTDSLGGTNEISKSIVVSAPAAIAVPVITSPLPTGELLYSVTSATISVKTDIAASCKFSTTDTNFTFNTTGTAFSTTGGTTHTHQVTGLTSGKSYSYYVKCQTTKGGITPLSKIIEFRIAAAPTTGGPTGPIVVQSPYGIYPNCIAPGVPIESQEWWQEDKNPLPTDTRDLFAGSRHVHVGVCAPNARTMADTRTFGGVQDFVAVVVLHNNPSGITWVAAGFQGNDAGTKYVRTVSDNGTKSTDWQTQTGLCSGGSVSCVNYSDPLYCSTAQHTCVYQVALRVDMRTCEIDGLCELRIRPNLSEVPPRNERAFTTLNSQINIGGGAKYRPTVAPIGRGWYTQLDYANASIDNYMDLYKGDFTKTVPVVSGTIKLNVRHREASSGGKSIASLRLDPSAHSGNVGTLVYEKPLNGSLNMDNVEIDTTKLTNGMHVLFITTQEQNDLGKNLGQLRLFINVQN